MSSRLSTPSENDLLTYLQQQNSLDNICAKNWAIPREMLDGLEHADIKVPFTINTKEYVAIRNHLAQFTDSYRNGNRGLNRLAFKAYLLFGTVQKLEGFVRLCNGQDNTQNSATVMLKNIDFPDASHWKNINFRAWGTAFLTYGLREIAPRFLKSSMRSDPVRNASGSLCLLLTDFHIAAGEKRNSGNAQYLDKLIQLAMRFEKNAKEFERAVKYMSQPHKNSDLTPEEQLPPFVIDGANFGIHGAVFRKLEYNDPRLLFLGDFTNCCERVTDAAAALEKTVAQACTTNRNAYYVVECNEEILAHSWAWRGMHGEFVFDGFESHDRNFHIGNLYELLEAVREEMHAEKYGWYRMDGLYVGKTANHLFDVISSCKHYNAAAIMPPHIAGVGMSQDNLYEIVTCSKVSRYTEYGTKQPENGHGHIRLG